MVKVKNYTYLKIKSVNMNRFVALLISGIIIFFIKHYLNYFGYVTDLSLIFIFSCALLKSATIVTIEYIHESSLNEDNKSSIIINKN